MSWRRQWCVTWTEDILIPKADGETSSEEDGESFYNSDLTNQSRELEVIYKRLIFLLKLTLSLYYPKLFFFLRFPRLKRFFTSNHGALQDQTVAPGVEMNLGLGVLDVLGSTEPLEQRGVTVAAGHLKDGFKVGRMAPEKRKSNGWTCWWIFFSRNVFFFFFFFSEERWRNVFFWRMCWLKKDFGHRRRKILNHWCRKLRLRSWTRPILKGYKLCGVSILRSSEGRFKDFKGMSWLLVLICFDPLWQILQQFLAKGGAWVCENNGMCLSMRRPNQYNFYSRFAKLTSLVFFVSDDALAWNDWLRSWEPEIWSYTKLSPGKSTGGRFRWPWNAWEKHESLHPKTVFWVVI